MPRRLPLLLLAALAALLPAAAQSTTPLKRPEVHGFLGVSRAWDDEGYIGTGPSAGFGIGTRLTRRLGVEGEYTFFRHKRDFGPLGQWKGNAHLFTANALLHFSPEGKVQPFLLIGAGGQSYEGNGPGFTWNCGAGIKAFLNDHLFLRPEVRLSSGKYDRKPLQPEPPISTIRFQFGVGYRW